uniref:Ubiquitin-like protease family profile domain-containing protein n=1 Tax=Ditylenchus dipsaci TaxID=166011 RepID=A0A915DHM7_9BILA
MNFELLTSKKNKPMLKDPNGCMYWNFGISRGKRTYWRCIHYRVGWDGRAVTFDGNFELTAAHNHYGDEIRAEMKRFQGIVQKQAVSSKDPPRSIIGKALKEVSKEAWGRILRSFAAKTFAVPKAYQMYGEETFLKFDGDFLKEFAVERGYDEVNPSLWIGACAKDIPTQSNSFDCGAFVCKFADCLSRQGQMKFSQKDMSVVRKEIEEMIRTEKL